MLVLSRKRNESVKVGANIEVIVVEVRGDKVRLGFRAPKSVFIARDEVAKRIDAGEPVHKIESDLDAREDLGITHSIPAASLPPEHRGK